MISITCDDGRVFSFEPKSTALLAIDFQRHFLVPGGVSNMDMQEPARLAEIVPAAKKAIEVARSVGIEIIHTRESYSPDLSDVTPLKAQMGYVGADGPLGRCLIRGEPGCDFIDEMRPEAGEQVFDKAGFSAFYGTNLENHLQNRGITHLIVTGVTYQCCVHSTLREAVDRGFYCLTLNDACAAIAEELEEATRLIIRSEGNLFGWIASNDSFLTALN